MHICKSISLSIAFKLLITSSEQHDSANDILNLFWYYISWCIKRTLFFIYYLFHIAINSKMYWTFLTIMNKFIAKNSKWHYSILDCLNKIISNKIQGAKYAANCSASSPGTVECVSVYPPQLEKETVKTSREG